MSNNTTLTTNPNSTATTTSPSTNNISGIDTETMNNSTATQCNHTVCADDLGLRECFGPKCWRCAIYWASIGFATALALVIIAKILICVIKCCCKKSPSDAKNDRSKQHQSEPHPSEPENDDTTTLRSSDQLDNPNHRPPIYSIIGESASPYSLVNESDEVTNPSSQYVEVAAVRAAKPQSVRRGNTINVEECVSAESDTVKVEATENVYDDTAGISAAGQSSIQKGNMNNNPYELATVVEEDTAASLYSDVANTINGTETQNAKDQKSRSPFAMNYASTIKSLEEKLRTPSNDLEADDVYDEAAIVRMNSNQTKAVTEYDEDDNLYEEASTVKLNRLTNLEVSKDEQLFQGRHSNMPAPSQGNHNKHGTEMSDAEMTLVENNMYGELKSK